MAKQAKGDPAEPSKMQMVREALEALGSDAKPKAIDAHVKTKYGVKLNPQMISAYKSTINSGGRSQAKSANGHLSLNDLAAIQQLVQRLGPNSVVKLVKMLG